MDDQAYLIAAYQLERELTALEQHASVIASERRQRRGR